MSEIKRTLKNFWSRVAGDGTQTTKHGHNIIPRNVTLDGRGMRSNIVEFMFQPRAIELMKQMAPLLTSPVDDKFILHPETGAFYLDSDVRQNGIGDAKILGQIDIDMEERLFKVAAQNVMMKKLFGDASHANPIVLDESTGRVYPRNNPDQTRGHVNLGPKVTR